MRIRSQLPKYKGEKSIHDNVMRARSIRSHLPSTQRSYRPSFNFTFFLYTYSIPMTPNANSMREKISFYYQYVIIYFYECNFNSFWLRFEFGFGIMAGICLNMYAAATSNIIPRST